MKHLIKGVMGLVVLGLAVAGLHASGVDVTTTVKKAVAFLKAVQREGGAAFTPTACSDAAPGAKPAPELVEDQLDGIQEKRRDVKRAVLGHAQAIAALAAEEAELVRKESEVKQLADEQARTITTVIAAVAKPASNELGPRSVVKLSTVMVPVESPAPNKVAALPKIDAWVLAGWVRVRTGCGTWSSGAPVVMNSRSGELRANGRVLTDDADMIWASSGNRQLWEVLCGRTD